MLVIRVLFDFLTHCPERYHESPRVPIFGRSKYFSLHNASFKLLVYIEQQLITAIQQAFQQEFGLTISLSDLSLQPTHQEFEGAYTFVTFPWAGRCQQPPEAVARQLGERLKVHSTLVADFNVVKGFLNIIVADQVWLKQLVAIGSDPNFGWVPPNGKKVVIEFSSPNTNKPLHLGHLRNNFLGHAVAEILKASGYEVYKVNLVNDRGIHICKSMVAYQQFGQGETPTTTGIKGDHLVGNYYVKFDQVYKEQVAALTKQLGNRERAAKEAPILLEAQQMLQKWEQGDKAVRDLWVTMNAWVYQGFEATYQQLGITFDKTYYESQTYLLGKKVVEEGLSRDIFYKQEDGSVWADLTEAGLDRKLVLRADGTSVYMTQDLGVADLRYAHYHFDRSIYVVGNEQDYHFEVLFKLMRQLGRGYAQDMCHLSYGMVDLPTGKMKSREGTVVDADQLMEEMVNMAEKHTQALGKVDNFTEEAAHQLFHMLAMGALKYFLLRVEARKRIIFDPRASIDFQGHTGPYIQYTHARIAAILRKAQATEMAHEEGVLDDSLSLQSAEREVIIQLYKFPQALQEAADAYSPAIIAQYAFELAKIYNRMYGEVPILHEKEQALRALRLSLSATVARTIQQSMQLLGIEAPVQM
jgi:arginyl-tRNA synthetase